MTNVMMALVVATNIVMIGERAYKVPAQTSRIGECTSVNLVFTGHVYRAEPTQKVDPFDSVQWQIEEARKNMHVDNGPRLAGAIYNLMLAVQELNAKVKQLEADKVSK